MTNTPTNAPQPPTIPDLPQQPTPTLDQQLAWLSLKWREAEFAQRELHEAAWAARHVADMAQRSEQEVAVAARHRADMTQRTVAETKADERMAEQTRITTALTTAHDRAAAAMEHVNTNGIPSDQPMVEALDKLRETIAGHGGAGQAPAAPEWLPELRAALTAQQATLTALLQALPPSE